jgi:hypothetical protein
MLLKLVECLKDPKEEDGVFVVYRHNKRIVRFTRIREDMVVQPPNTVRLPREAPLKGSDDDRLAGDVDTSR